jgi:hypothetical protein
MKLNVLTAPSEERQNDERDDSDSDINNIRHNVRLDLVEFR